MVLLPKHKALCRLGCLYTGVHSQEKIANPAWILTSNLIVIQGKQLKVILIPCIGPQEPRYPGEHPNPCQLACDLLDGCKDHLCPSLVETRA